MGYRMNDAGEFLHRVGELVQDEAKANLILGIALTIERSPEIYPDHDLFVVTRDDTPVAAALVTHPHNLILADGTDAEAVDVLSELVTREVGDLPGVVGNRPTVDWFVERWEKRSGASARLDMDQGVYALESVSAIVASHGRARKAEPDDFDVVVSWLEAFGDEVVPGDDRDPDRLRETVHRALSGSTSNGYWLWEYAGEPVSMSGYGKPTGSGVHVGPVYTPPGHRRRGYAAALVAYETQWLLDSGYRFCFLYTDMANPTSNEIYKRIGYHQVAESAMYHFD